MKLCVKHKKGLVEKYQMDILKEFILQLQKNSHEWAHCYDHQEKHIKDRNPIGGEAEDFANEKSGEETKRYIKSNPRLKSKIFKPV